MSTIPHIDMICDGCAPYSRMYNLQNKMNWKKTLYYETFVLLILVINIGWHFCILNPIKIYTEDLIANTALMPQPYTYEHKIKWIFVLCWAIIIKLLTLFAIIFTHKFKMLILDFSKSSIIGDFQPLLVLATSNTKIIVSWIN